LAGKRTVCPADPLLHETLAGMPRRRGDELKTQTRPRLTEALSRTLPPAGGRDLALARKYLTVGWLAVLGVALAGRLDASTHIAALTAGTMLGPRMFLMPGIFQVGLVRVNYRICQDT